MLDQITRNPDGTTTCERCGCLYTSTGQTSGFTASHMCTADNREFYQLQILKRIMVAVEKLAGLADVDPKPHGE